VQVDKLQRKEMNMDVVTRVPISIRLDHMTSDMVYELYRDVATKALGEGEVQLLYLDSAIVERLKMIDFGAVFSYEVGPTGVVTKDGTNAVPGSVFTMGGTKMVRLTVSTFAVLKSDMEALDKALQELEFASSELNAKVFDKIYWTPESKMLKTDLSFFTQNHSWYEKRGVPYNRSYLLYGPPGNGKSMSIRKIAEFLGVKPELYDFSLKSKSPDGVFMSWMLSREAFERTMQHMGRSNDDDDSTPDREVRRAGKQNVKGASGMPYIRLLVLEDLDRYFPRTGHPQTEVSLSCILNCLDGAVPRTNTIVIATANDPEALDAKVLLRPGRFNRRVKFPLPLKDDAAAFVKSLLLQDSGDKVSDETLTEIATKAGGQSFAFFAGLYETAASIAFEEGRVGMEDKDIHAALAAESKEIKLKARASGGVGFGSK